jgi:hypothetical protein
MATLQLEQYFCTLLQLHIATVYLIITESKTTQRKIGRQVLNTWACQEPPQLWPASPDFKHLGPSSSFVLEHQLVFSYSSAKLEAM